MTTELANEHHEILFKLFIIASNNLDSMHVWTPEIVDEAIDFFDFQFNDRAICEPEQSIRERFNDIANGRE